MQAVSRGRKGPWGGISLLTGRGLGRHRGAPLQLEGHFAAVALEKQVTGVGRRVRGVVGGQGRGGLSAAARLSTQAPLGPRAPGSEPWGLGVHMGAEMLVEAPGGAAQGADHRSRRARADCPHGGRAPQLRRGPSRPPNARASTAAPGPHASEPPSNVCACAALQHITGCSGPQLGFAARSMHMHMARSAAQRGERWRDLAAPAFPRPPRC